MKRGAALLALAFVGGCSSTVPLRVSKPGTPPAQVDADIQRCQSFADEAKSYETWSRQRAKSHNSALVSCLQSFGYKVEFAEKE